MTVSSHCSLAATSDLLHNLLAIHHVDAVSLHVLHAGAGDGVYTLR